MDFAAWRPHVAPSAHVALISSGRNQKPSNPLPAPASGAGAQPDVHAGIPDGWRDEGSQQEQDPPSLESSSAVQPESPLIPFIWTQAALGTIKSRGCGPGTKLAAARRRRDGSQGAALLGGRLACF